MAKLSTKIEININLQQYNNILHFYLWLYLDILSKRKLRVSQCIADLNDDKMMLKLNSKDFDAKNLHISLGATIICHDRSARQMTIKYNKNIHISLTAFNRIVNWYIQSSYDCLLINMQNQSKCNENLMHININTVRPKQRNV